MVLFIVLWMLPKFFFWLLLLFLPFFLEFLLFCDDG